MSSRDASTFRRFSAAVDDISRRATVQGNKGQTLSGMRTSFRTAGADLELWTLEVFDRCSLLDDPYDNGDDDGGLSV